MPVLWHVLSRHPYSRRGTSGEISSYQSIEISIMYSKQYVNIATRPLCKRDGVKQLLCPSPFRQIRPQPAAHLQAWCGASDGLDQERCGGPAGVFPCHRRHLFLEDYGEDIESPSNCITDFIHFLKTVLYHLKRGAASQITKTASLWTSKPRDQ